MSREKRYVFYHQDNVSNSRVTKKVVIWYSRDGKTVKVQLKLIKLPSNGKLLRKYYTVYFEVYSNVV